MKFLVDAQLPRRVAWFLRAAGHEALHTLDLLKENKTPDNDITKRADADGAVVVTKDSDFVNSFLIKHEPAKLLLIATGNITNLDLDALLATHLAEIIAGLTSHDFVELTPTAIILRA